MLSLIFLVLIIIAIMQVVMLVMPVKAYLEAHKKERSSRNFGIRFHLIFLIVCIVLLIALNFSYNDWAASYSLETQQTAVYELVSIKDTVIQTEVKIRYVTASVNQNQLYTFYYKENEDGGYMMKQVNCADAVVYEEDECEPTVEEYTIYKKTDRNPDIGLFLWCLEEKEVYKSYKIIVPKGTVVQEYSLDAQ